MGVKKKYYGCPSLEHSEIINQRDCHSSKALNHQWKHHKFSQNYYFLGIIPTRIELKAQKQWFFLKWIFSMIYLYISCIFLYSFFSLDVSIGPFSVLSKSGFEINKTCFMKKDIWHGCNLKVFCPNQINRIWLNHLHDDSY